MIKTNVSIALRDLARLGVWVENYPTSRGKGMVKVLEKEKPAMMVDLRGRLVKNLRKLSPGFAWGNSRVERNLKVLPGTKQNLRGVSGFHAIVDDELGSIIAHTWNDGVTIKPKNYKYLAEPLRGNIPPNKLAIEYGDDYTTWFYNNYRTPSMMPNIKQDVRGLMVIRSKNSFVMERRMKKGKMRMVKVGKTVARYVLMKSQTILPTYWADKALQDFKQHFLNTTAKAIANDNSVKGFSL